MYENPNSLEEICLDTICDNILTYVRLDGNWYDSDEELEKSDNRRELIKKYKFKDPDLFLINEISEKLFQKFLKKNMLYDATLYLFTERNTKLRSVKLKNSRITSNGLKILKEHKISDLECIECRNFCIGDVLDCLSDWSIENITNVNFSKCTFINNSRHSYMVKITNLKLLKSLNLSYTELNQITFKMICEDLKFLEKLDISGTLVTDLSPLLLLYRQLISLKVCDLYGATNFVTTILQMNSLRYLDISLVNEKFDNTLFPNNTIKELLENSNNSLNNLISIDLSGWRDSIPRLTLLNFLDTHPKIEYLGIVLNELTFDNVFNDENNHKNNKYIKTLSIAGLGNEKQITLTLKHYSERSHYVQKALYHLFQLTNTFQDPRPDIFNLVLPVMAKHSTKFGVQMAATACLYNLTRAELSKNIHPKSLTLGINLTLNAMEYFPDEFQLQKNSLLTLCSDRILQDINFDRFRCARLVLDALCAFDDLNMNRMAVAICSILAAKVSTEETSELGARPTYMKKLLSMVKNRVDSHTADITLKFTLSALWNLTDESSATCAVFLQQDGALLFLNVLKTFKNDSAIETKVLGLLNNIAEVIQLRHNLMLDSLMSELFLLLNSKNIDVSYFAAGIVAHLASDGIDKWTVNVYKRSEMLDELENAILDWKVPDSEMVAYRSFRPFFSLLKVNMAYQVQLWAVWAIHHVCTKSPQRYCQMLQDEGGHLLLNILIEYPDSHSSIKLLSSRILEIVENHNNNTNLP